MRCSKNSSKRKGLSDKMPTKKTKISNKLLPQRTRKRKKQHQKLEEESKQQRSEQK